MEFSSGNKYLLAADEDFSPFRARVTVAGGAEFNAAEATDTMSFIADLPGRELGPSTTCVCRACPVTGGDPLVTNGVVVSAGDLPGVYMRRADPLSGIFGITNNTDPAVGTEGLDVAVAMPAGEKLGERELA